MFDFFFFNDTATTEIYTLSLHDALPISPCVGVFGAEERGYRDILSTEIGAFLRQSAMRDRKSTRLNSSHVRISYAVFCLKKKSMQLLMQVLPQRSPAVAGGRES